MNKFTLSVDSTCDLYHDFIQANDIKFVPLTFNVEKNGVMEERLDEFTEYQQYVDFYNELRAGAFSKTAMLNYEAHFEHFVRMAKEGAEDVLHFTISSGLARTHEVAEQAAADVKKEYPKFNLLVLDPLTTTVGCGALVRIALQWRNDGKGLQETYDHVNSLRLRIQHFIVAEDLPRRRLRSAACSALNRLSRSTNRESSLCATRCAERKRQSLTSKTEWRRRVPTSITTCSWCIRATRRLRKSLPPTCACGSESSRLRRSWVP